MRPVRRGAPPQANDYQNYRDAFGPLVGRIGAYCSYCERLINTNLAVEHIQPKALPQHKHLEGRWENFLLGCVNCNSAKGKKEVVLSKYLIPDRDNTAAAFLYAVDGSLKVDPSLTKSQKAKALATLQLVGLDKPTTAAKDENGKFVATDRVQQRIDVWKTTAVAQSLLAEHRSPAVLKVLIELALHSGHFSIWMTAFAADVEIRLLLIQAFAGTAESKCFDAAGALVRPAPNPDGLQHGGKL